MLPSTCDRYTQDTMRHAHEHGPNRLKSPSEHPPQASPWTRTQSHARNPPRFHLRPQRRHDMTLHLNNIQIS